MNLITDVGINLLAAALGFLIAQALRIIWRRQKYWAARRFWLRFIGNGLTIALPHYSEFRPHESIGVIATGEIQGLLHFNRFLTPLVKRQQPAILADDIRGEALNANLLILGGPRANRLYGEMIAIIHPQITFRREPGKPYILVNGYDHKEYSLAFHSESGEVTRDYCIINYFPNPYASGAWVMLIAGLGTYGTWGGIEITTTKPFLQNRVVRSGKPFEALVEIEVGQYKPISRLLTIHPAPQK